MPVSAFLVVDVLCGACVLVAQKARGALMYQRKRYPPNWPQLSRDCKEQAGWQCQHCAVPHGTQRVGKRSGRPYRVALAASHLDHDPENPHPRLAALCPECHGRYDWAYHERQATVRLERMKHQMQLKRWRARQDFFKKG
ncbi:MAG TPA: hypothetical protein VKV40_05175 [Ktedonobacteraceae bacterium]|nr:hypothetical protein [Ktedonobacteraceae bacterium]